MPSKSVTDIQNYCDERTVLNLSIKMVLSIPTKCL